MLKWEISCLEFFLVKYEIGTTRIGNWDQKERLSQKNLLGKLENKARKF